MLRGFWARISILLGLVFGYLLSWLLDATAGQITRSPAAPARSTHPRPDRLRPASRPADWFGLPDLTAPHFSLNFALLVLPAVIALIAENTGHVKAVARDDQARPRPVLGRAISADGVGTVIATSVGGSPTTTYAENIGVMAATRVYSTAAYYVAAIVAILLGLCPKFGALVAATPGGVLGGITVVLYGMIGLLGAKIWKENRVDFANPINLVPLAAGIIIAIGNVTLMFSDDFSLGGHRARHDRRRRRLAPRPGPGAGRDEGGAAARGLHRPASGVAFGHVHGDEEMPDPSSVDEVGGPGAPGARHTRRGHAQPVKPAPFRYADPGTLDEALAVLADEGEGAKVLAGGQSLLPLLSMRLAAPTTLVDINRVPGLDTVEATGDGVTGGGAGPAQRSCCTTTPPPGSSRCWPGRRRTSPTRRSATGGPTVGSIAHADPSGEMTSVLALTDGSVTVATPDGVETVGWRDFFVGPLETSMHGPAVVTSAFFPALPPRSGTAFAEVARRKGDYAVCGAGVVVTLDADRRVAAVRAAYVSVGPGPRGARPDRRRGRQAGRRRRLGRRRRARAHAGRPGHRPARQRRLPAAAGRRADRTDAGRGRRRGCWEGGMTRRHRTDHHAHRERCST